MQHSRGNFSDQLLSLWQIIYDTAYGMLFHHHVPDEKTIERIDKNRVEHWDKFVADTNNPLINHLKAFGYVDEAGNIVINDYSIYTAMKTHLKMSDQEAESGAGVGISVPKFNKVDGVSDTLQGISGHFTPKDAMKLMHPFDTGLYQKDTGLFMKNLFDTIKKYTIPAADGRLVISETAFHLALTQLPSTDDAWKHAGIIYKSLGKIGHDGEFTQLFSVLSKLGTEKINGVPHYLLADIEEFYLNTAKTMERIRNNDLSFKTIDCTYQVNPATDSKIKYDFFDKVLLTATTHASKLVQECPNHLFDNQMQRAIVSGHSIFARASDVLPMCYPDEAPILAITSGSSYPN